MCSLKTTIPQVEHILNHDVPILVYAGDQDFATNWVRKRNEKHCL